ncbi:MAG: nickel-responsive transcriptional regulator NikR [Lentisphaerae bacterium]|nr:nickel-responsive transcriptional regulator NikR [Lentisphaerota bacterium]
MAKKSTVNRVSLALDEALLRQLDAKMAETKCGNRSEFVREVLRDHLVGLAWEKSDAEMLGTITLLYNHHQRELCAKLTELQHDSPVKILASTHVHLSHELCAEMIMAVGAPQVLHDLHHQIRQVRGVLHATLSMSSSGSELE